MEHTVQMYVDPAAVDGKDFVDLVDGNGFIDFVDGKELTDLVESEAFADFVDGKDFTDFTLELMTLILLFSVTSAFFWWVSRLCLLMQLEANRFEHRPHRIGSSE